MFNYSKISSIGLLKRTFNNGDYYYNKIGYQAFTNQRYKQIAGYTDRELIPEPVYGIKNANQYF